MNPDDRLSREETAKILGVRVRQVDRLGRSGTLMRRDSGEYDANEVLALAELRKKSLSLVDVAMLAKRAEIASRRTERIVNQLLEAFDLGRGLISLEPDAVKALHTKVEDALLMPCVYTDAREVTRWASTFNAIGEEYFEAVALYVTHSEPWYPYVELARTILVNAPKVELRLDNSLRLAYECLHKARKGLIAAGYNYARTNHGKVLALKAFPDIKGDAHDSIMQIAIEFSRA